MSDIFLKSSAYSLLKGKFILLMGDSNMRVIYKDIIYLLHNDSIIPPEHLRKKNGKDRWASYYGDKVLELPDVDTPGRDYYEEREFKANNVHLRFHFVTKVLGAEMNRTLNAIEKKKLPCPDIIIVNSCIWDLTRWGPFKEDNYKNDLIKLFTRLRIILSDDSLIIWTSTLPISTQYTKGGLLIKQLEFMRHALRFIILEANHFTHQLCVAFGLDFLDLHYHMRFLLHRRSTDGIHWEPQALRHINCILLTHISLALGVPLPGHVQNNYVKSCVLKVADQKKSEMEPLIDNSIKEKVKKELNKIQEIKKISNHSKKEEPSIKGVSQEPSSSMSSNIKTSEVRKALLKAKRKKKINKDQNVNSGNKGQNGNSNNRCQNGNSNNKGQNGNSSNRGQNGYSSNRYQNGNSSNRYQNSNSSNKCQNGNSASINERNVDLRSIIQSRHLSNEETSFSEMIMRNIQFGGSGFQNLNGNSFRTNCFPSNAGTTPRAPLFTPFNRPINFNGFGAQHPLRNFDFLSYFQNHR